MKTKKLLKHYLFLIGVLLVIPISAQETTTITGMVNESGINQPIPGASIVIKNTTKGVVTDFDGNYTIEASNGDILVVSYLGFKTQEKTFNGQTTINFNLDADTQLLDEVVIVGYGSQSSRTVTGAVQQLDAQELADIPVPLISQKLQGRLVGVQINQTTGKPGQGMQIKVRGSASLSAGSNPLYVVDGTPMIGDISFINPYEIDNISVLKDAASTSLYGSRAANGVVLVTTKMGKPNQSGFTFSTNHGIQVVPERGRPDIMNGTQFAQFKKESYEDLGQAVPEAFQNPSQYGDGYSWYDAMLQTAPIQSYNLSWSNQNEKSNHAIVAGYFNQDGVMINSNFKRYSVRANSSFNFLDNLKLGISAAPSFSINNTPGSDGIFWANNAGQNGGLFTNSMLAWPIIPYVNDDETYPLTAWIPGLSAFPNPNFIRSANEIKNTTETFRLLTNAYLEYKPIEGLTLKTAYSADMQYSSYRNFQPSTASIRFASLPPGLATSNRTNSEFLSYLNENTLVYDKSFGNHNLQALIGFSIQKYEGTNSQLSLSNFPDDRITTIQSAVDIIRPQSFNNTNEWGLLSYFSRLNYNYDSKYLLSLAMRRDGSSRFGSNNLWGNFPSISTGWVISDESFLENSDAISFAKLRASIGIVGNNNIGNYTQYALVNNSVNAIFGNAVASGAAVTTLGNANLGWERTKQFDIGADFRFLNDKLEFSYDYYKKNTTDLLYAVDIPQESGFTSITDNIGEIEFWGHEFAITSRNFTGENFNWSTSLNIAFSKNKVLALTEGVDQILSDNRSMTRVGEPLGQFWGLIHDGVYDNQEEFDNSPVATESQVGTVKFADTNGSGDITNGGNDDDRTFIGNPFPDYTFGITNDFKYKNFDASIVIAGSVGNDIAVLSEQGTTNLDGVFNVLTAVENRWRSPENPGDGLYGKTTAATFMERDWFNSRFVRDGSHLTVKNISIGYSFPLNEDSFLKKARIYTSVQQAFVFTKYDGSNPEVSVSNLGGEASTLALGFDSGSYPVPRTFTMGLNLSF